MILRCMYSILAMLLPLAASSCALNHSDDDMRLCSNEWRYIYGRNTAQEFHTSQWKSAPIQNALHILKGEMPGDREHARALLREYERIAIRDRHRWTVTTPVYEIPRAQEPLKIDGIIGPEWSGAFCKKGVFPLNSKTPELQDGSVWRIMWDSENLYVSAEFHGLSSPSGDDGMIYDGDCMELFLSAERNLRPYWEIIVNPDNQLFSDYRLRNPFDGGYAFFQMTKFPGLRSAVKRNSGGYTVELAVPWRLIPGFFNENPFGCEVRPGSQIDFALLRFRREAGEIKPYSAEPLLYGGHNTAGYIRGIMK